MLYAIIGMLASIGLLVSLWREDVGDFVEDLVAALPLNLGTPDGRTGLRIGFLGGIVFSAAGMLFDQILTPLATVIWSAILAGALCAGLAAAVHWRGERLARHAFHLASFAGCRGRVLPADDAGTARVLLVRGDVVGVWPAHAIGDLPLVPGDQVITDRVDDHTAWVRAVPVPPVRRRRLAGGLSRIGHLVRIGSGRR